jgi:BMFP domain-containing protein YqiC
MSEVYSLEEARKKKEALKARIAELEAQLREIEGTDAV